MACQLRPSTSAATHNRMGGLTREITHDYDPWSPTIITIIGTTIVAACPVRVSLRLPTKGKRSLA